MNQNPFKESRKSQQQKDKQIEKAQQNNKNKAYQSHKQKIFEEKCIKKRKIFSINPPNKQSKSSQLFEKFKKLNQGQKKQNLNKNLNQSENKPTLLSLSQLFNQNSNNYNLHLIQPFSSRSQANKKFYTLQSKLHTLDTIIEMLHKYHSQEINQMSKQMEEVIFYNNLLQQKWEQVNNKAYRLKEIKEKKQLNKLLSQQTQQKSNQALLYESQTLPKPKKGIFKGNLTYCYPSIQKPRFEIRKQQDYLQFDDVNGQGNSDRIQRKPHILRKKTKLKSSKSKQQIFGLFQSSNKQQKICSIFKETYNANSQKQSSSNRILSQSLKEQPIIIIQNIPPPSPILVEIATIQSQNQQLSDRINILKIKGQQLKETFNNLNTKNEEKVKEIKVIKRTKQLMLMKEEQEQKKLEDLKKTFIKKKQDVEEAIMFKNFVNYPIDCLYHYKKYLNNQLQQIRGNIRVYCRIRPLASNQTPMKYQLKSHDLLYIKKTLAQNKSQNLQTEFQFDFDRIFDQNTTQQEVFAEISQVIQTAIDGKNVCIFAYGQTGSGKTFTMQGSNLKQELIGLIPRSTQLIFKQMQKYKQKNWKVQLSVSIYEIYNDCIVNLLFKSQTKYIRPIFTPIKTIDEVQELFKKASSSRSTAFTLSNADSSRSHLIFIIKIKTKTDNKGQKQKQSHLVLIDLAGSQRVKQSGVSNQRMKQAQHINKSLSQLGQVIRSLKCDKQKTNFRNSKLTYFLEPYLKKGSKAIMFVNISPALKDQQQSLNSLKFASIARQCRLKEDE